MTNNQDTHGRRHYCGCTVYFNRDRVTRIYACDKHKQSETKQRPLSELANEILVDNGGFRIDIPVEQNAAKLPTYEMIDGRWMVEIDPESGGLSEKERLVMDNLIAAWNGFAELYREGNLHGDYLTDFRRSIHEAQRIISTNAMRRMFWKYW
jgi:hypothetical protein